MGFTGAGRTKFSNVDTNAPTLDCGCFADTALRDENDLLLPSLQLESGIQAT